MNSPSPSSSAVTIPTPGKSILKRPPPPQQSLFSRITRFLPAQNEEDANQQPLKRAHFILPQIATVYSISTATPPSTPNLKEDMRMTEERERERRRRVLRCGGSESSSPVIGNGEYGKHAGYGYGLDMTGETVDESEWWSMEKVESFYRECCAGCDEVPDPAVANALKHATSGNGKGRTVDLSGVQLTATSAAILSDIFSIEWGLRKLVFRECDLEDLTLKPILHALLIPNSLSYLSIASNRRLKTSSIRLLSVFLSRSISLQFLDLSQNTLDKKAVEYVVSALVQLPQPPGETKLGLMSLKLDDCQLRPAGLEVLARAIRTSSLRHVSLRHNRISPTGAVALAVMIRDYPEVVPANNILLSPPESPAGSVPPSPTPSFTPLPPPLNNTAKLPPPPRHPPTGPQTTYTPYIPRSKRGLVQQQQQQPTNVPILKSSSQGGITTRSETPPTRSPAGPSAALLDKVRALDALPRLGALRTLDLRGNDLRNGVTYIAQVLKRNRTLRVLNLSENKLDVAGLAAIAEALIYNSSLETLDLSRNPCSGPALDGIQSLRTSITLNTSLKRLFLSATHLTTDGAIALAEFIPESTSLLHLDLTQNNPGRAGIMALSSGLKANHTMRCLDLDVPPGDEELAKLCQNILKTCIRNTEEAEKTLAMGRGVWGMIEESELAKRMRFGNEAESAMIAQARECIADLRRFLEGDLSTTEPPLNKSNYILAELTEAIQTNPESAKMDVLLGLNDDLRTLIKRAEQPPLLSPTPISGGSPVISSPVSSSPSPGRPQLSLKGLGIKLNTASPNGSPVLPPSNWRARGNGEDTNNDDDDEVLHTPSHYKGKGRAEPQVEKVLSPTRLLIDGGMLSHIPDVIDEEEEREQREKENETLDRSKSWVEEEGEVFRKGTVLLGPEEMEGDFEGEELRKELLDAMVERTPRPKLAANDLDTDPATIQPESVPLPTSPVSPIATSPSTSSRPYLARTRSASMMSVLESVLPEGGIGGSRTI